MQKQPLQHQVGGYVIPERIQDEMRRSSQVDKDNGSLLEQEMKKRPSTKFHITQGKHEGPNMIFLWTASCRQLSHLLLASVLQVSFGRPFFVLNFAVL